MKITGNKVSDAEWLALCLITESNQAHEWQYIYWCIKNRVSSRRYPNTFREVILQDWQFSHFNAFRDFSGSDTELLERVLDGKYTNDRVPALSRSLYSIALEAAEEFLKLGVWHRPFSLDVTHYWSPISMKPVGAKPAWAKTAKRIFTPSGVDPFRFQYAEGVA